MERATDLIVRSSEKNSTEDSCEMERPKQSQKWSDILATIGMKGFSELSEDEKSRIMLEFQQERRKRIEEFQEKRANLRESELRRAVASEKIRSERESEIRRRMEEERANREKKMREWLVKVKQKDAIRAKAKEDLRRLAELELTGSAARRGTHSLGSLKSIGSVGSARHVSREIKPQVTQPRSKTPPSSSRSALEEYMKFSSVSNNGLNSDQARYREIMEESNYAQNVRLASTIYSRKLKI